MKLLSQTVFKLSSRANYFQQNVALYQFMQKASYTDTEQSKNTLASNETEKEKLTPEEISKIRNVSHLRDDHYRMVHGEPQFLNLDEATDAHQQTLRWRRKQFGLYGMASGINPAICFTTKEELNNIKQYEKIAFSKSIMQLRDEALQRLAEEKEQISIREKEIEKKLENLEVWKKKIRDKMEMKKVEVDSAKQERERLLEEVRRYFGYTIDPKDDKFQIMLEYKEKEQLKLRKQAKKKEKEEKFLEKLAALESNFDSKKGKMSDNTDENNAK